MLSIKERRMDWNVFIDKRNNIHTCLRHSVVYYIINYHLLHACELDRNRYGILGQQSFQI